MKQPHLVDATPLIPGFNLDDDFTGPLAIPAPRQPQGDPGGQWKPCGEVRRRGFPGGFDFVTGQEASQQPREIIAFQKRFHGKGLAANGITDGLQPVIRIPIQITVEKTAAGQYGPTGPKGKQLCGLVTGPPIP